MVSRLKVLDAIAMISNAVLPCNLGLKRVPKSTVLQTNLLIFIMLPFV